MSRPSTLNLSRAYAFWIGSLMFGLPLLTSFYVIQNSSFSLVKYVLPYILLSLIIGFFLLSRGKSVRPAERSTDFSEPNPSKTGSFLLAYLALSSGTVAVISYWLMKYYVASAYPSPISPLANLAAIVYLVSLSLAGASGVPFLLLRIFPVIGNAFSSNRNYYRLAVLIGIGYFITYLILVNQIIVTGYNTPPGNFIPPPSGTYPFGFVFAAGPPPNSAVESAFYVPQLVLQINQYFNLLVLPFEVIFATILSSLVAGTVVATLFMIRNFANHSCLTGATVSGLGGFFGFTATCPTCLVPTLVSVFFGGVSATVPSIYSHLSGVILPPLVSVATLLGGLLILNLQSKKYQHPVPILTS
jgi:hypothetical protein